jgi:integrase
MHTTMHLAHSAPRITGDPRSATAHRHLLEAGVPIRAVSERLGHANATTTLGIYAHEVRATDQRSAELLGDLLAPKEPTPSKRKRRSSPRKD